MADVSKNSVDLGALAPALRALAARGTPRAYRKGTLIIEEGTQGDTLYLLLDGRVRAFSSDARGREIVYGVYGPGDYFGEMSLDGGPRSASVIADSVCRCALLTRQTLREHIRAEPEFAFELIERVIRRARMATQSARSMALLDVYGRLVQLLEGLSESDGQDGLQIRPRPTHAELASRVGCSREMVSRLMRDLINGGYIRVDRSSIQLLARLPQRW